MKVTITIKGQCIVYFKEKAENVTEKVWNVVFVTDDCHTVKFVANPPDPDNPQYEELAKKSVPRTISFDAVNATPATGPDGTGVMDELLNLSENYLHGVDEISAANGDKRSNLEVKPGSLNGRHYIHMQVPYGDLAATWTGNEQEYFIEEEGTGLPQSLGRSVASGIEISFDIDDASELTMTISDSESGASERKYSGKADQELIFNNDCEKPIHKVNDILNIYDWIYDRPSGGVTRFFAGKLWEVGAVKIVNVTGDCDPVGIEPPPWP